MVRRQKLLPPTQFTFGDKLRLLTGVMILGLGIGLLWRTMPLGLPAQAVLVSAAFIGFGVYRLWLGYMRFKQYKSETRGPS
jgi:hypothetical protein